MTAFIVGMSKFTFDTVELGNNVFKRSVFCNLYLIKLKKKGANYSPGPIANIVQGRDIIPKFLEEIDTSCLSHCGVISQRSFPHASRMGRQKPPPTSHGQDWEVMAR